ncbi:LPS ABC transporter [Candidatus Saccharibacteria bacterium CG10_big_fil_rev_8_21_14_0_10_47_8]|nr:MAG: LPS ABC transporter [Candidatus Saccharibacteria bacterium CG10_big_fil_rev_8_21_14_0_10_47_8]
MIRHVFSKKNRALLAELVRTDFKLRYQGSALGYAWSLLRPLLLFIILYLVFAKFLKLGTEVPHFPVYLLLGIVIWNFFNEMTVQSLGSIVGRGDLIRKIRIPRWIIVLSTSISTLINLFLNLLVVVVFLFINHVDLLRTTLWLPLILLEVYIFALGLSLFLSAAYVKYRDVNYIWEVILQAGFYLTPILYPLALITNVTFQKLIMLNPMSQAIQDIRYAAVTHQSRTIYQVFEGGWYKFIPFIIVVLVFLIGLTYFRKESKYFAENI